MKNIAFGKVGYRISEVNAVGGIGFQTVLQFDKKRLSSQRNLGVRQGRGRNVNLLGLVF